MRSMQFKNAYFLLCTSYTLELYIFCLKVINIKTVKRGPLDFYCVFYCMVFVLTCLMTAYVHAETCCIHVRLNN